MPQPSNCLSILYYRPPEPVYRPLIAQMYTRGIYLYENPHESDTDGASRPMQHILKAENFDSIVRQYGPMVYGTCIRILNDPDKAEDATQETFIAAFRALPRFRGENLRSWLLTIAVNRCRDELRSPYRRRNVSLESLTEAGDPEGPWASKEPSPEEHALGSELSSQVQQALQYLPPDQRTVVTLVDLQGLDYSEAAAVTGASLGTVKSRLSRGRDRLRHLLRPLLELPAEPPR